MLIICLVSGGLLALWFANLKIPSFDNFTERIVAKSTKIYDRSGEILLYDIHSNIKRQVVPLEQISTNIRNATIAIEDDRFYQHRGVVLSSIIRAFIANLGTGSAKQGGSTITQQLVKNSLLTKEKSWARKIKELIISLKLERVMSKDEILAHYLNEIPYGGSIYGVEEAAESFFGKPASEVNLAEAAYLAAIPKAPTYYSPYGSHRSELEKRKNVVINRMAELGLITEAEKLSALAQKVSFSPPNDYGIRAPHFVLWVRDYLEEKYGESALNSRGLRVTTTLDWQLQEKAEQIVKQFAEENLEKFNARNAGLVAIDPKTGQVLVMVGSKDYFNVADEGNFNITLAHRQPGSAFKPFAYAEAFNKGYTPETMLFDLETQFDTTCRVDNGNCYKPKNYDDKFRGPMSMREALAQSINIPSIKVLYLAGLKDTLNLAKNMGISSLTTPSQYGLTLVLGGGEVSLLELTSAYGVFANEGVRHPHTAILRVEDDNGVIIEEFAAKPREVLPANTARLISDILSDNQARIPAYGANSPLYFPERPVAAKTGTTNDSKDAWIVGYTPNIAVGAWAGNNDNSPMEKKVAGLIVAPLWHAFMAEVFKTLPPENFVKPAPSNTELPPVMRGFWQGGKGYLIDKMSGKLATPYTPPETQEERVLIQVHSILYWLNRQNDPQFPLWETPIRNWVAIQGIREQTDTDLPLATDDVHLPEYKPSLMLIAPELGQKSYPANQQIRLVASYSGRFPLGQVDYFLNDTYLGSVKQGPVEFSFVPSDINNITRDNELHIVVRDSVGNKNEITTRLFLSEPAE